MRKTETDTKELTVGGRKYLVYDPVPSALREERERTLRQLNQTATQMLQEQPSTESYFQLYIPTDAVVEHFLKLKEHKRVKEDSTLPTYRKRLAPFQREFSMLPVYLEPLLDYLARFDPGPDHPYGESGRHKLNNQVLLKELYDHAIRHFGLLHNPLDGVPLPSVTRKPVRTLTLEQVAALDRAPETTTERAAWEILAGHGWRQVEDRRILAGDVRRARDNVIWCRGKHRSEDAPILTEVLSRLHELTPASLPDDQPVLRSTRIRNGSTQPLGEDGMSQLVGRLFARAGMEFSGGHILRKTFATLARDACGDEFLPLRLIRDKIRGMNDVYYNTPMSYLVSALDRYSPLRLIARIDGQEGEFDSPPSPPETQMSR